MNIFDSITIIVLSFLIIAATVFSLVFSTSFYENKVEQRLNRTSATISWDELHPQVFSAGYVFEAYSLQQPEGFKGVSEIAHAKQVRKMLEKFLKYKKSNVPLNRFSNSIILMNNVNYSLYTSHVNVEKTLPLDEILWLCENNFDPVRVAHLRKEGMTFEEIKSLEGVPTEWALKVFK